MTRKYVKNPNVRHGHKRNKLYRKHYCIAYYNLNDEIETVVDNIYGLANYMGVSPKKAREIADYQYRKQRKHKHKDCKYHLEFIKMEETYVR